MNRVWKQRDFVIYNVIFPLWAIFFFSPLILVPLLGNLIIDGLVKIIRKLSFLTESDYYGMKGCSCY